MVANRADSRRWVDEGTRRVAQSLSVLDQEAFGAPSALPGWTRKHIAAHLAVNAGALSNLVRWAATGVESRMYAASEHRTLAIETGATRTGDDLRAWFANSSAALAEVMDALTPDQWRARVVSLQERAAPASQVPWVRARELLVHAVDLDAGLGFTDLPWDFLAALCDDIVVRRSLKPGNPAMRLVASDVDSGVWTIGRDARMPTVTGPLAKLTAYLAGRPYGTLTTQDQTAPPTLPRWL